MRKVKLFALLAVAAGALLVPVGSASAADSYTCSFSGVTGNLNPPIPSILADGSADSENGTFTFAGGINCVGTQGVQLGGTVNASGAYSNTLCGTGSATGAATLTSGARTVNVTFTIQFIGGAGVIQVTSGATGAGYAQLVPNQDGNCVTTDVSRFQVLGGFSAVV
jgi:hypothetical protein